MTKEIEKVGIPIVQMANLVTIAETVGSNRIVPTISIPYPLGDPNTSKEEQWKLRRHRVEVAINTLASEIEETTIFEVKI
jgi:glycine reductase